MKNREEIYNQVIQEYSHLQNEFEGDELQDKINEIVENVVQEELHYQAIELMEKIVEKYKKIEIPLELMSLDEFLYEYTYILSDEEIDECIELIDKF
tara:strand:- start:361 stop:651 length:291 start_codon:yes stop_codon:yes gene_type:complete